VQVLPGCRCHIRTRQTGRGVIRCSVDLVLCRWFGRFDPAVPHAVCTLIMEDMLCKISIPTGLSGLVVQCRTWRFGTRQTSEAEGRCKMKAAEYSLSRCRSHPRFLCAGVALRHRTTGVQGELGVLVWNAGGPHVVMRVSPPHAKLCVHAGGVAGSRAW
jgi:hypothetical protein